MRHPGVVITGLIVSAALTGCTAVGADQPGADGAVPSGVGDGWSLALGDCVDVWNGSLEDGVSVTSCSEPHDWEVYYRLSLDDPATAGFPGNDPILAAAEEACAAQFLPFLGVPAESGPISAAAADATDPFGYTYLSPPEAEWPMLEQHAVSCLIGDMNGQVTGSLAGTAAAAAAGTTAAG